MQEEPIQQYKMDTITFEWSTITTGSQQTATIEIDYFNLVDANGDPEDLAEGDVTLTNATAAGPTFTSNTGGATGTGKATFTFNPADIAILTDHGVGTIDVTKTGVITTGDTLSIPSIVGALDGDSAVTGYLTNESHVVQATSDGFADFNLMTYFKVFQGLTEITTTAGIVYSGTPYNNNDLSITINPTSGAISCTTANNGWSGLLNTSVSVDFTATALDSSWSITKTLTITKSIDGETSINGYLTNESISIFPELLEVY